MFDLKLNIRFGFEAFEGDFTGVFNLPQKGAFLEESMI